MKSKRGVALAYVIVVTAALLVLVVGFVALTEYNLNASQTSLEGRQAYLDARSAIEFGRAYLAENPDAESFTIVRSSSGSGFAVGALNASGAIASYDQSDGQINAKVPYSSSGDRLRLLSYRIGEGFVSSTDSGGPSSSGSGSPGGSASGSSSSASGSSGGSSGSGSSSGGSSSGKSSSDVPSSGSSSSGASSSGSSSSSASSSGSSSSGSGGAPADYLVCAANYGATPVIDNINTSSPTISENRQSAYPVVVRNMLQGTSDWDTVRCLTAPEIYLLCQPTSFQFYNQCYAALKSNFICIGGSSITGQDYRSSFSDLSNQYCVLMLKTNPSGGTGVLCFTQNCTLTVAGNQNARTVLIPKGYYAFSDNTNLYDLTSSNFSSLLKRLDDSALPSYVSKSRVQFITSNVSTFLAGGNSDWNYGAYWTDDAGDLANGRPSNGYSGHGYNLNSNEVFFYITSCRGWEAAFDTGNTGPNVNTGIYQSKQIYMRYVNSTDDFTIPAGKTIVYQSNKIWMNTAKSDTSLGGDVPITAGSSGSQFVLKALSGSGGFELDVPAALTVKYTNLNGTAKSYRIPAGTYQLAQSINLFSDSVSATLSASKSS
jgi:hypothetical protein